MHCPVLFDEADGSVVLDVDKELAKRTRERLMRELEEPATISADGHFPPVRVTRGAVSGGPGAARPAAW
jgi:hypothetical protein